MNEVRNNPIQTLAEIVSWISSSSDVKLSAFIPRVVTVSRISAGTTWNVIPSEGELEGTIRTLDDGGRAIIKREFENALHAFEVLNHVTIAIEWQEGSHVAFNHEDLTEKAFSVAEGLNLKTVKSVPSMIGDDFGDYAPAGSGKISSRRYPSAVRAGPKHRN